jgi:hypothetical protein
MGDNNKQRRPKIAGSNRSRVAPPNDQRRKRNIREAGAFRSPDGSAHRQFCGLPGSATHRDGASALIATSTEAGASAAYWDVETAWRKRLRAARSDPLDAQSPLRFARRRRRELDNLRCSRSGFSKNNVLSVALPNERLPWIGKNAATRQSRSTTPFYADSCEGR